LFQNGIFLPFYAILRSIPDKLGGVIAIGGALVLLLLLPFIQSSEVRSAVFRPIYKFIFWRFVADFLILGWIGQKIVETPFIQIGQIATFFYFLFILVIVPGLGYLESYLIRYDLSNK
jgi:quinol-cytochrome oxidoreductase complex cytochrome b subunit